MREMQKAKILSDSYERIQREAIASSARIKNSRLTEDEKWRMKKSVLYPLNDLLEEIDFDILKICEDLPVYTEFLADKIKGIETYWALRVIVLIGDIKKFKNISALWKYSGLAPVKYCRECGKRYFDNTEWIKFKRKHRKEPTRNLNKVKCSCRNPTIYYGAEAKISGLIPDYNEQLKKAVNRIGQVLIEDDGYYQEKYDDYFWHESQKVFSPNHAKNRARRKVVKLFMYHLFNAWRELEGLEAKAAYIDLPEME